jgi:hypothetical protein
MVNHIRMKNFDGDEIDMDRMKSKYGNNPLFRTLMDFLADQEKVARSLTVDKLHDQMTKAGLGVSRTDVVRMFQVLHGWDCGWFTIGRRGLKSRFWFNVSPTDFAKEVSGKGKKTLPMKPAPKMLTHKFQLRADLEISLELPVDLSDKEVGRIADFLKTLPFEHAELRSAA